MKTKKDKKRKVGNLSGFTIVEVIIACTIISVTVLTLMSAAGKGIELSNRALRQTEANMLLEEGVEAVKTIRDTDWTTISNLSLDTDYYLFFDTTSNTWTLNTSSTAPSGSIPTYPINSIFDRKVVVSNVERDSSDNIVETGTIDEGTKKVNITVSWPSQQGVVTKSLIFYLADIFN
jgi:Tfp pilus assembly protein PilV